MAQRKTGFSSNSNIQGDKLILNYGLTAAVGIQWAGETSSTYNFPEVDGASSSVLTTDGNGNLVWSTINTGTGNVQGTMSTTYIPKFITGYGLTDSSIYNTNNQILFPAGQSGTPSIAFQGDTDLGIYRSAANQLTITTNGTDVASFKYDEVNIQPASGNSQIYVSNGGVAITQNTQIDISTPALRWTGHSMADEDLLYYDMVTQTIKGTSSANFIGTGATGAVGATGAQGTYSGPTIMLQSGTCSGDEFSGSPLTRSITFVGTFTQSYNVFLNSDISRDWTIINKNSSGFDINSNSITSFTELIEWTAIETSATQSGMFIGAQGIQGPQGATGATGADGPVGATGTGLGTLWQTLQDTNVIGWTFSNGVNAQVTLTADRQLSITGATAGNSGVLKIIQGGAGSFRINFGANDKFPSGTYSFTTVAGRWDMYGWTYDGTYFNWSYANNYY